VSMSHEVGYTSAAGSFAWRVSEGGGARTAFGASVGSWRVRAGRGVVCSVPSATAVERPDRRPLAVHAAAVVGDHLRAASRALPVGQFLVHDPCRRVTGGGGGHHSGPGRERGPAGRIAFLAEEIPNYGERHRCGEPISTATAEGAVNRVISRRMVNKQQMRCTFSCRSGPVFSTTTSPPTSPAGTPASPHWISSG
jgi:hypothetical protein